jgi:hypothetical protein
VLEAFAASSAQAAACAQAFAAVLGPRFSVGMTKLARPADLILLSMGVLVRIRTVRGKFLCVGWELVVDEFPGFHAAKRTLRDGWAVNRDELQNHLALIERAIENGKRTIEEQRALIEREASSGLDQSEALAVLARLLKAQRDLENNRDELLNTVTS